jgi:hypothetical protein
MKPLRLLASLATVAAALLAAAPGARAESHDPQHLAFGWLTENADAVVVAVASADRTGEGRLRLVTLTVEESLRGTLAAGAEATLEVQDVGEAVPYALGARHLAFLRALPVAEGQPARFGLLSGEFGIRAVPAAGPEARFPDVCRRIAATLDARGAVRESARYRMLLVETLEDADAGIAWSGATDLVRHEEMHAELTGDEKRRIVRAFVRQPIGRDTKKALALAAAATRDPEAAPALVASLLHPRSRETRIEVGEALRRLADPAAAELLAKALPAAETAVRETLLNVLGALGASGVGAAAAARDALSDPVPSVRVEAAQALGLLARAQHRADPDAALVGRAELARAVATASTENELLANVWALAQYDEPEAYEALRRLAASDERAVVRKAAERYLANPRLSLVLR